LKLARNFACASFISCSLCSSNFRCSSADRVSQVGSMMLLEETSELSFELAIEGRSDRSSREFPSGVAKKCVDADLGAYHGDEYWQRCSLRKHGWSMVEGRTVRDLAQRLAFCLMSQTSAPSGRTVRACSEGTSSPTSPRSHSSSTTPRSLLPDGVPPRSEI
jgi:hypothetical protein